MGKASRELAEARKACFEVHEEKNEDNNTVSYEYKPEEDHMYRVETSILLRKRLIEYSQNSGLSLCEHLDTGNVDNFVNWIIKNA